MAIHIVPQQELAEQKKQHIVAETPLLLYPDLKKLYPQRIKRLQQLALSSPFADYLMFVADIVSAQQKALIRYPLKMDLLPVVETAHKNGHAVLDPERIPYSLSYLQQCLFVIIDVLQQKPQQDPVSCSLKVLHEISLQNLQQAIKPLLQQDFQQSNNRYTIFLWAALSLYWAQMATSLPGQAKIKTGKQNTHCPVCHGIPVASIVRIGDNPGVRYLHCSLCETEWYMTRVMCSNCEQLERISYYSLDEVKSAIKAEYCQTCNSYLKIFYQDIQPQLDIIADDLASLSLNAKLEEKTYLHTGLNPFLMMQQT